MDALTFWSKVIESLSWPVCIFVIILVIRAPLFELLPNLKKLKYKGFEAEFADEVRKIKDIVVDELVEERSEHKLIEKSDQTKEAEQRLFSLAKITPNAAVLVAWKEVEIAAKKLISNAGITIDLGVSTPYRLLGKVLDKTKLVDTKRIKIFNDLRNLRNKVAHAGEFEVSAENAREYVSMAFFLILAFESKASTHSSSNENC